MGGFGSGSIQSRMCKRAVSAALLSVTKIANSERVRSAEVMLWHKMNGILFAIKANATKIKTTTARLVRDLPDTASWDDLMY
jgi:hypothetical protein